MNALEIFRMVATEFGNLPDDDIVNEGKVTQYGVKSFIKLYSDQISEVRSIISKGIGVFDST